MPTSRSIDRITPDTSRKDNREIHFDDRYLARSSGETDYITRWADDTDLILVEPENTTKRTERTPI